jgi:two-component system response regulator NreC
MAKARKRTPIRVLIADDHAVLRVGLHALLDATRDMRVVGEAATGEEAVAQGKATRPDVVVMDVVMPGIGGLEAIRRLVALKRGIKVLALSAHGEDAYLVPVLEAGGSGYVTKTCVGTDLVNAIRAVARGEAFLYPSAANLLLRRYKERQAGKGASPLNELSKREHEVLMLTAEGYTAAEIAAKVKVSPKTVDTYRSRVMQKLGLTRRAELVRLALRTGLLHPP